MLRRALSKVQSCSSSSSSSSSWAHHQQQQRRRWLTAAKAKTPGGKRALKPDQLGGAASTTAGGGTSSKTTGKPPPPTSPTTAPPPPIPPAAAAASSGGGGGGSLAPLAAVGALALGGAAYYFYSNAEEEQEQPAAPAAVAETSTTKATREPAAEEKIPKEISAATQETATGNRVISIGIPGRMKNSAASVAAPPPPPAPSHPEGGNRVAALLPGPSAPSAAAAAAARPESSVPDASPTRAAVRALQDSTTERATAALVRTHQSLWSAMDESFFADLDRLSNAQLKARVAQLAAEMKDRTKWEAVRLKEFLAMKEKETSEKYLEILQKQRLEFEDLMAARLREQRNELSTEMLQALQAKEGTIQGVLKTALEAQQSEHEEDKKAFEEIITGEIQSALDEEYGKKMEEYKNQVAHELQQKVSTVENLTKKLHQLESALEASTTSKEGSLKAHRLSAAALALAEKMETNQGAAAELAALKLAAGNEGVIATACANIPDAVRTGVPTLAELQARFEAAQKKSRQAALVPAGRPGLDGQLAGMVFASLKYAPDPDDPAPEHEKDSAEYVLARARRNVQNGELERAVDQLEKLKGQPAFTIADWKKDAINRIAVEKALKVIKMECALLNQAFV